MLNVWVYVCTCVFVCEQQYLRWVIVVGFYYPFYILKLFLEKSAAKNVLFYGELKVLSLVRILFSYTYIHMLGPFVSYVCELLCYFFIFSGTIHIMRTVRYLTYCIFRTYRYHYIISCNKRVCTFSFVNAFQIYNSKQVKHY